MPRCAHTRRASPCRAGRSSARPSRLGAGRVVQAQGHADDAVAGLDEERGGSGAVTPPERAATTSAVARAHPACLARRRRPLRRGCGRVGRASALARRSAAPPAARARAMTRQPGGGVRFSRSDARRPGTRAPPARACVIDRRCDARRLRARPPPFASPRSYPCGPDREYGPCGLAAAQRRTLFRARSAIVFSSSPPKPPPLSTDASSACFRGCLRLQPSQPSPMNSSAPPASAVKRGATCAISAPKFGGRRPARRSGGWTMSRWSGH